MYPVFCRVIFVLWLMSPTFLPGQSFAGASLQPAGESMPVYGYEVVRSYPHDPGAFTQGLVYAGGFLYESTGLRGRSSLRKVDLETGRVLRRVALPRQYFGEGLTLWGDDLIQLTWKAGVGLVYELDTLKPKHSFRYRGQGWGLTHDGSRLIMSDGSSFLRFLDPETHEQTGRLQVREGDRPVDRLNELEWVQGEVWANVWQTDRIVRVCPGTGQVLGWIDLSGLREAEISPGQERVLNGIAYDPDSGRLFVTGKSWTRLYEITVIPRTPDPAAR
ncbi:MAG: glutaminyl-peptide cyclotransferase [Desulfohalobiaceae bacterium]